MNPTIGGPNPARGAQGAPVSDQHLDPATGAPVIEPTHQLPGPGAGQAGPTQRLENRAVYVVSNESLPPRHYEPYSQINWCIKSSGNSTASLKSLLGTHVDKELAQTMLKPWVHEACQVSNDDALQAILNHCRLLVNPDFFQEVCLLYFYKQLASYPDDANFRCIKVLLSMGIQVPAAEAEESHEGRRAFEKLDSGRWDAYPALKVLVAEAQARTLVEAPDRGQGYWSNCLIV